MSQGVRTGPPVLVCHYLFCGSLVKAPPWPSTGILQDGWMLHHIHSTPWVLNVGSHFPLCPWHGTTARTERAEWTPKQTRLSFWAPPWFLKGKTSGRDSTKLGLCPTTALNAGGRGRVWRAWRLTLCEGECLWWLWDIWTRLCIIPHIPSEGT